MVIDKTTGKGCALSIASKVVAKRLISEGIVGKLLSRRYRKTRCYALRVVDNKEPFMNVELRRDDEAERESLWFPSFLDAEIWAQAVEKFQDFRGLDQNVEKFLLPEMDEYLQNITDTELVSITRDFLIERGATNGPIAQKAGKTYYFSEDEIYSLDATASLFRYDKKIKFYMPDIRGETCFNLNVWRKAVSDFKVGMTLEECIKIFLKTELAHRTPQELSPADRLVLSIAPFLYERVPGNDNESTFDRIRTTVGLPRYQFDSWEALRDEVGQYKHEIYQRVIEKLQKDRQFKRYGVPINFLRLSNVILLRDFSLEFIFELKERVANPPSETVDLE